MEATPAKFSCNVEEAEGRWLLVPGGGIRHTLELEQRFLRVPSTWIGQCPAPKVRRPGKSPELGDSSHVAEVFLRYRNIAFVKR